MAGFNLMSRAYGNTSRSVKCDTYLAATQRFADDLRAVPWPAGVQPLLDEVVASAEYDLFLRDDDCMFASQAQADDAAARNANAVFAWRTAIGLPTDF